MKRKLKILQSNCSEEVFRLTGTFQDIKKQLLNMVTAIEKDRRKEDPKLRKKIQAIKNLKEVEDIFIPTTNYNTYFKQTSDGDLMVATCNNVNWDCVNFEPSNQSYYSIASKIYCLVLMADEKHIVLQNLYTEFKKEEKNYYVLVNPGISDEELNASIIGHIELFKRGTQMMIATDNRLIPVSEEKNEELCKKIILAGMLKGGLK
jgi:hypothetical protein